MEIIIAIVWSKKENEKDNWGIKLNIGGGEAVAFRTFRKN